MDDLTGQLYGGYQLIEHLHRGGEADIYRGSKQSGILNWLPIIGSHKTRDGIKKEKTVIIRIFRGDNGSAEDIKRRYQREVEIYRKLTGAPYIIHPLSSGEKDGRYYIVMPYIAKGSLKDAINYLSPGRCLTYIKQAAEALSCIHKEDYMHRDVKPKNLLLGDFGILLSDFGLACEVTTTPLETRGDWGSLFYIAPEQRNGYPCEKSDQYSLARSMCFLLTKKEIKLNEKREVINEQEIEDDLLKKFPKIFKVYKQATSEQPEKRFATILEFKKALESAENSPSSPPPTSGPFIKKSSRRKATIFLLLALPLMVASIISGEYLHFRNIPPNLFPPSLTVTTLEEDGSNSLRQAIDATNNKQVATIRFDPSLQGTIELTKGLEIPTNVSIEAPIAHQITIIPQNPETKILVPQGSVVSFANIDFKGKNQERSSAFIENKGTLYMRNCHISDFKSTHGGGALDNLNGILTFTQSKIDNNESFGDGGGAIYNFNGTIILDNSKVHDNRTHYNGGGIYSLNGHVYIQNDSSIYSNKVLARLSGSDTGGGGGMLIHGGSLSITNSSINNNSAIGNGGGILLVGTSAYIDNSPIQYNTTDTDQAGGIAVIYNPENNHHSILTIANNTPVQYNANNSFSNSNDTIVDIQGKVLYQDHDQNPMNKYIISESGLRSGSTTFDQFLGYLTLTDFKKYCQSQQNSQKSPSVEPSSGAQKIICTFDDGETLELSTQNGKVNQVCAMLYPTAKNLLARLFRYTDITTWQCFNDEQHLSNITSNMEQPPLNKYCQDKLNGDNAVNNGKTAYDWHCKRGRDKLSINMDLACQYVTNKEHAIAVLEDYNNPRSWQCWGPR